MYNICSIQFYEYFESNKQMNKLVLLGLVIFVHAKMAECWCCGCSGGYPCAATEGCNIFCCNCAGSCQKDRICKINETSNGPRKPSQNLVYYQRDITGLVACEEAEPIAEPYCLVCLNSPTGFCNLSKVEPT